MNRRPPKKKSQSRRTEKSAPNGEQQGNSNIFPIVGIGASAGGLEAFTQLLQHLPTNTGMGFVLVQHLSPDHKSLLREILSRATEMPVHEVVDNTTVEPNQLYVIPPGKQMVISEGVLKLMPREKIRGLAMTVDTFFFSLASDRGNKALAIVLSGGDSDGALGAKAIKAAGGITFAQCEDTAQVSSMPNTAVATGHVDFILTPSEIAAELAKISRHPYVADTTLVEVASPEELIEGKNALQTIFVLLRVATGVDFSSYKHTTLQRRIYRRMMLYQILQLEDYVTFLQNNPVEVQALYEDVLINVTSFMRDKEAFEALKTEVFPIITKDKSARIATDLDLQKEADRIVLNRYAPAGVVTNFDLEILQFRGQTSRYLEPTPGRASLNLLKMVREDLRLEVRTAVGQAKKLDAPVTKEGLQIWENEQARLVTINIIPFKARTLEERYFLILFEDATATLQPETSTKTGGRKPKIDPEIQRLQQELKATKEHLQSVIEEQEASNQDLRAANEEILSSNEELQSTNEELETAKEEIQATNEELNTVNDELYRRNLELNHLSNDLENLLSSTNIPIVMLGADVRIRRFTPLAQQILNLIPTDVGRPLRDINHNLNIPGLEQEILSVINTFSVKEQEVQDQKGHWYDLRIRPYRTIDNKIDGAVMILVDIDALKRSSEQLTESRNYAEAIVETMREPLVVLDTSLKVITANRAFYETFEVTTTQVEGRPLFELGNGQWNIPDLRELLEQIVPSNNQLSEFQNLVVEHEFEQIGRKTMMLNARRMSQPNHQDMILLAIDDITQQEQLRRERSQLLELEQSSRAAAEAANRSKDEFLSILSHELRNPLNSLLGWAQLLRRQKVDASKLARGLEAIENSAKIQTQLIEDLLDISRITSGKMRLDARLIELAPIIETAIEVVRVSADAKQIQLVSTLDAASEQILGDPVRLQQIIWNLLTNAIKFTPPTGRVEIKLEYIDSTAQIQVSDTGKGINAEFLPYVFERFRQADSSQSRANPGIGLGLAIVSHLVELHGGTVSADSLGEEHGATFTVRLPKQTQISKPAILLGAVNISMPVEDITTLAGVRVLILDDSPDVRELFTVVLEGYGADVTTVATPENAIQSLIANPNGYDVLLSDISMPGEDGYTFIRRVRQLGAELGGQIPAAALTANARSEDSVAAITAGFQMHLTKPVPPDRLAFAVANLACRFPTS
ncbi:hypothetical protein DSM106972_060120 [Dulcicalothrix desertica PCC 7102]|uniref:Circadian input-output histidine kinase CikA n=1 Tax=Dulcicalothrix desertica PCC 7102 TaxID=232991 RepID=A0A3S1B0P5_9CYAN|nr:chemotaxis protein CheB [Dulcicalothrix desertica]RUT02534.1 hypothetical protein DSM106972_060120 [Dulcicalothrix desertica PCC 7102]TWH55248.1 two-component system CheB/CheR fusion protein [Dulcicalothrix desertica PCC 7102]